MEKVAFSAEIPGIVMEQKQRSSPFTMNVVHAHAFWELYYLLDGECVYFVDGKSYSLQRGAFVFIGTNCLHRTVAGRHERILVELDPASLAAFSMHFALLDADRSVVIQLSQEERACVETFLRCMVECLTLKPEGYVQKTKLYLLSMLSYVDDHAHTAASVEQQLSPRHRQAERVIRYLEENYTRKIMLDDVAQALFTSKYHLSHAFKQVTGFTLVEYLLAVRLRHARELLATGNLRVAEIAEKTGFSSLSHFNRSFRRQAGIPPLQYRKSVTGAQAKPRPGAQPARRTKGERG